MGNGSVSSDKSIDELAINTIRFLAIDGVEKAKSGHPGMPMGDAPMAHILWSRYLNHTPVNPAWPGRDRFVLSAGHGSMLLYSLLHLSGYDLPIEELKSFRQWGSRTPGHPEYEPEIGIETTTGPLGAGFATGVGMALAERYMAERYNRPGFTLFDYNIYAITSDGDMMEGVSNEAASTAGHLGLGNIVYLYSANQISIEGSTDIAFTEDVAARFRALKWHVQVLENSDDTDSSNPKEVGLDEIDAAIKAAKEVRDQPSLIMVRTHIGFGSPAKHDSSSSHGSPLGEGEVRATKEALGWPVEPEFLVPENVKEHYAGTVATEKAREWDELFARYATEHPELAKELKSELDGVRGSDWKEALPEYSATDSPEATRSVSGKVLNAIAAKAPFLVGGSADLAPSNNTELKEYDYYMPGAPARNIHFGVREHAMGSLLNGMALSGAILPFGATFLVFSDYMRPAIRLAALMGLQVVYIFTHDSIGLGEDGPTHQPIEHIAALRAIPGLTVIRPADATETVEAWTEAIEHTDGPVALILTRQKLPMIDRTGAPDSAEVKRGAYVVSDASPAESAPDVILIASGSEVSLATGAATALKEKGKNARVVSVPSFELFELQSAEYKESVLPIGVRARVSIEAGSSTGWHRYIGLDGQSISIDRFGASAPAATLFEKFGFTVDNIVEKALQVIK
ncbi:MAG: transketolase [Proteobacteria bacterium]|nr:transketolase [Pseudomonadota bacterium]